MGLVEASHRSSFSPVNILTPRRRRSSQQNNVVDMWQQRFLLDMDEAEPWQRELIKYHREETKDKRKADVGVGVGAARPAHLVTPANERPTPTP